MTERELVARARAGDQDAFEQLVLANEKRVYNLACRLVGDRQDALDQSQEAFLKAWRGLKSFHGESSFSTWLYRLTVNACLDFLRVKKRRQDAMGQVVSLDDREHSPAPRADEEQEPERRLERRERAAALHRGLEQLPDRHREILTMRELLGLSYREISEMLSLDLGTVKSRIARARLSLRDILRADGNFFHSDASNQTERTGRR